MKLIWLGYLVYSLGNCVMKLCIETGLNASVASKLHLTPFFLQFLHLAGLPSGHRCHHMLMPPALSGLCARAHSLVPYAHSSRLASNARAAKSGHTLHARRHSPAMLRRHTLLLTQPARHFLGRGE